MAQAASTEVGMTRIKDWRQFQHYQHRDPPWIKLHRGLLNDREWFGLDGDASKVLIMCWLIAAENDGNLPSVADLAFRFRMTEKQINAAFAELSPWLEDDASNTLADCKHDAGATLAGCEQLATTETETEIEIDISIKKSDWPDDYRERFWQAYPRKIGKKAALRKLETIKNANEVTFDRLLSAIGKISATEEKFIPHPTTWLNHGRYLDGEEASQTIPSSKVFIPVDTPQWGAWVNHRRSTEGRSSYPQKDFQIDGRYQRGWWFESEWPPDHKPQVESAHDGATPLN
jgi:hypothetical protein